MIASLFENECFTKQANEIALEFRAHIKSLLEKYKEYSTIELESIMMSEVSVTTAETRLCKQINIRMQNRKDSEVKE